MSNLGDLCRSCGSFSSLGARRRAFFRVSLRSSPPEGLTLEFSSTFKLHIIGALGMLADDRWSCGCLSEVQGRGR